MQVEIGERIGISQQQVSHDLKRVREQWMQSSIRDFDAVRAEQLAKIDEVERQAWEGWRRSFESDKDGEPRYLDQVHKCIERRCKMLGLDAAQQVDATVKSGDERLATALNLLRSGGRGRLMESKHGRNGRNN